ncbi:hypothetical protein [Agreia sp. COWG]|uniref:hypothetical protein n=1 Tax=Agreia sp. COWG TaxID=2773266 RepID=UPI001926FC88|nr:hypothetical protein [Agreia sp. COWG]
MTRYVLDRDHADEIRVRDESAWDFRVLGGVLERVRRAAHAYLVLDQRGFAVEGRFLVRSAIEHAVTAQWAYLTPDGIDRLEVKMVQARLDYAKQSRDVNDPEWADVIAGIEAQFPTTGGGIRNQARRNSLARARCSQRWTRRGTFNVLTRCSHVSDMSATKPSLTTS